MGLKVEIGNVGPAGPSGSLGPTGYQGSQGSLGSTGFQGSQGAQGLQGIQGIQGTTGNVGNLGPTGYTGAGSLGPTGPAGSQGTPGSAGALGPTGSTGNQGSVGYLGPTGPQGDSGASARTTAIATATSLAAGANSYQTFTMAKSFSLTGVSVDNKKCRVRLYARSAARTADVARGVSVPLALGEQHGCIADFYFDQYYAVDPWICSPPIMGANMDTTPATAIYATITNMGLTAQTIEVTLTYIPTES